MDSFGDETYSSYAEKNVYDKSKENWPNIKLEPPERGY